MGQTLLTRREIVIGATSQSDNALYLDTPPNITLDDLDQLVDPVLDTSSGSALAALALGSGRVGGGTLVTPICTVLHTLFSWAGVAGDCSLHINPY